jgi:hypothetical protein
VERIIIIVLSAVLFSSKIGICQMQPVSNILTPNKSTVPDTYVFAGTEPFYTPDQLIAINNSIKLNYPCGAELVGTPTNKYNCHAYTFHVSEGENEVWVGWDMDITHNIYWMDGSYIEVSENESTKVIYHSAGNHSAIRLDNSWYQSKWGASALVQHPPNCVPAHYQASLPKKFYKLAPITGANTLSLDPEIYKLNYGQATHWSVTGNFSIVSSNATSATVKATAYNGQSGTLTAVVNGITITKSIQACHLHINGPSHTCGSTVTYSLANLPSGVTANQVVWSSNTLTPVGGNTGLSKTFTASGDGRAWVRAQINSVFVEKNDIVIRYPQMRGYYIGRWDRPYYGHEWTYPHLGYNWLIVPESASGITDYRWEVTGGGGYSLSSEYGLHVYIQLFEDQHYQLFGFPISSCGESVAPSLVYNFELQDYSPSPSGVSLYPNPASDILTIELDASSTKRIVSTYNLRLYNILGDLVHSIQTKDSRVEFNVANLPNGIYYLHIYDGIGNAPEVQKVIVRR